jgi:U3 small nucleolar RNA-associated protein 12
MNLLLVSKILNFLLKTHFHQLAATRSFRPLLLDISEKLRSNLLASKDAVGYNMAALEFISTELTPTPSSF